jgi:hypothetical protein
MDDTYFSAHHHHSSHPVHSNATLFDVSVTACSPLPSSPGSLSDTDSPYSFGHATSFSFSDATSGTFVFGSATGKRSNSDSSLDPYTLGNIDHPRCASFTDDEDDDDLDVRFDSLGLPQRKRALQRLSLVSSAASSVASTTPSEADFSDYHDAADFDNDSDAAMNGEYTSTATLEGWAGGHPHHAAYSGEQRAPLHPAQSTSLYDDATVGRSSGRRTTITRGSDRLPELMHARSNGSMRGHGMHPSGSFAQFNLAEFISESGDQNAAAAAAAHHHHLMQQHAAAEAAMQQTVEGAQSMSLGPHPQHPGYSPASMGHHGGFQTPQRAMSGVHRDVHHLAVSAHRTIIAASAPAAAHYPVRSHSQSGPSMAHGPSHANAAADPHGLFTDRPPAVFSSPRPDGPPRSHSSPQSAEHARAQQQHHQQQQQQHQLQQQQQQHQQQQHMLSCNPAHITPTHGGHQLSGSPSLGSSDSIPGSPAPPHGPTGPINVYSPNQGPSPYSSPRAWPQAQLADDPHAPHPHGSQSMMLSHSAPSRRVGAMRGAEPMTSSPLTPGQPVRSARSSLQSSPYQGAHPSPHDSPTPSVGSSHASSPQNLYTGIITKRSRGRRVPSNPDEIANLSKGAKVYTCKVPGCGKCFKRSEHLKRHVRSIHTDEKREWHWPRWTLHTMLTLPF